jgi:ferrous iron transport protein A
MNRVSATTFICNDSKYHICGMVSAHHESYICHMLLKRLSDMAPLESGIIDHVEQPEAVTALIEMGCCPGEPVRVAHVAPGRGPMAIHSCGRKLALRRSAAEFLWVRIEEEADKAPVLTATFGTYAEAV